MQGLQERLDSFVKYAKSLEGDEKGQSQLFCDHLFRAFGHPEGIPQGEAKLEYRVIGRDRRTRFADLVWKPRLVLEMKSRGANLQRHYRQVFDYWIDLVPHRPKYAVLCDFDAFWVYDFNEQMEEPVDRVLLEELPERHTALNFFLPEHKKPIFKNNRVGVTQEAAEGVAAVFRELVTRGEERKVAQRFILQCVVAMFAEDTGLIEDGLVRSLLEDCQKGGSSYDLLGGLFQQMNTREAARGGRYKDVPYFNGGLFQTVAPIELTPTEIERLLVASDYNWSKVQPVIFGSLFESSMDAHERHATGAHYTSEADIYKVIRPTISWPWHDRIADASTLAELTALHEQLGKLRVLDPACGSGNFLYTAFRELKHLETELLHKTHQKFPGSSHKVGYASRVGTKQFFGIDINPFAVELAKVTLMLGKELAHRERREILRGAEGELGLDYDTTLPLDNLDENVRWDDALFCDWPQADAIIGNPPYLGSRYIAKEHGHDYARKLYERFPGVPKMADYCTHWFRLAHDRLPEGGRSGLVGTNTIRQNESRKASLDYVIQHGGTITDAVATQVWGGDAAVHVSIVNWVKGAEAGKRHLHTQLGDAVDSPWKIEEVDEITGNLSSAFDTAGALPLKANDRVCFTGQNPVNEGFFLEPAEARQWLHEDPTLADVLFPYLIGRDLLEEGRPTRWIIDFGQRNQFEAMKYPRAFERLQERVMPVVLEKAEIEKQKTGKEITRYGRLAKRWWQFYDYRPGTIAAVNSVPRYIACSRVTKRPIFQFVSSSVHPDTAVVIFRLADDYSFGILQSGIHAAWFKSQCSTLKGDSRYTSDTVFDPFPWPQRPSQEAVQAVSDAAVLLRQVRDAWMAELNTGLRGIYRLMETPGDNPLRDAHKVLDDAVREAYDFGSDTAMLSALMILNQDLAEKENRGEHVRGPGLTVTENVSPSTDCIKA